MDEAADWYEKADWFGIHACPTANFLLDKYNHIRSLLFFYTKYNIPMKDSIYYEAWTVNWPYFMGEINLDDIQKGEHQVKKMLLNQLKSKKKWLYDRFSRIPISSKDISKLTNTLSFYEKLCKNLE